jgi:hypothetical protein
MIKVQNNVATRDPLPLFLQGLEQVSLADLSWADPALGVSDCAWLPEVDESPALGQYERYGAETLTVRDGVVVSVKQVVPFTQEEIDAVLAEQAAQRDSRKNQIQSQISSLQSDLAALG